MTEAILRVTNEVSRHLPSNYRPISLTSIVVKVMERIIHCQLVSALSLFLCTGTMLAVTQSLGKVPELRDC